MSRSFVGALALRTVVAVDLELTPLDGDARSMSEWLTTFPLVAVVLDPYTHESAWVLDSARRILTHFNEADCRPCWIVTSDAADARRFLGPYAEEFLTFTDPNGATARGLGMGSAPAIALIRQDGELTAKAEGWNADEWREVVEAVTALTKWSRPEIPAPGDPVPFPGTSLPE